MCFHNWITADSKPILSSSKTNNNISVKVIVDFVCTKCHKVIMNIDREVAAEKEKLEKDKKQEEKEYIALALYKSLRELKNRCKDP